MRKLKTPIFSRHSLRSKKGKYSHGNDREYWGGDQNSELPDYEAGVVTRIFGINLAE
jgi:hypothetical protein